MFSRSKQNRYDVAVTHIPIEIVEYLISLGFHIREQLLHQHIIVVGKGFKQGEAFGFLQGCKISWYVNHPRFSKFLIDMGAFEGEIDKTRNDALVPDRQLPQHQGLGTGGLHPLQNITRSTIGLVNLVEKYEARQF